MIDMQELSAWVLWGVVTVLALVLYIRVDIHDWGMVGFTAVTIGAAILMSRSLLGNYGHDIWRTEMLTMWRVLLFVGGPLATAGVIAGWLRDPPPRRQIVVRLVVLGLIALALTVAIQAS